MMNGRTTPTAAELMKMSPAEVEKMKAEQKKLREEREEAVARARVEETLAQFQGYPQYLRNQLDNFAVWVEQEKERTRKEYAIAEQLLKDKIAKRKGLHQQNNDQKHQESHIAAIRKPNSLTPVARPKSEKKPVAAAAKKEVKAEVATPTIAGRKDPSTAIRSRKDIKPTSATAQAATVVNMERTPFVKSTDAKKEVKTEVKTDAKAAATEEKSLFVEFIANPMPDFSHDPRRNFKAQTLTVDSSYKAKVESKGEVKDDAVAAKKTAEEIIFAERAQIIRARLAELEARKAHAKATDHAAILKSLAHDEASIVDSMKALQATSENKRDEMYAPLAEAYDAHVAKMDALRKELTSLPRPHAKDARKTIQQILADEKEKARLAKIEADSKAAAEAAEKAKSSWSLWPFGSSTAAKSAEKLPVFGPQQDPAKVAAATQTDAAKVADAKTSGKNMFTDGKAAALTPAQTPAVTPAQPEKSHTLGL